MTVSLHQTLTKSCQISTLCNQRLKPELLHSVSAHSIISSAVQTDIGYRNERNCADARALIEDNCGDKKRTNEARVSAIVPSDGDDRRRRTRSTQILTCVLNGVSAKGPNWFRLSFRQRAQSE
jgi:hypothetical protein